MTDEGDVPSPDRYLDATFGEGGYLSRAFPGYTPRAGQVAFAHAVDRSIVEKRHLLAEAGTGVGKSIGYSVPATYHAVHARSPIVIVTANIALQEQIANKDLPMLQKILPWAFTFQLLKGRNNYLCLDTFLKTESGKVKPQGAFSWGAAVGNDTRRETHEQARQRDVVTAWARDSLAGHGDESGDASELPFEVDHHVWRDFSVSADACKGYKCRHAADCFSQQARVRAQSVNVIVTNYHMLCAHLAVYMKTGLDLILPPFEVVVCDEAHRFSDIARDFFGFRFSEATVKTLAKRSRNPALTDALLKNGNYFFSAMSGLRRDRNRYKAHMTIACIGDHELRAWRAFAPVLDDAVDEFASQVADAADDDAEAEASNLHTRAGALRDGLAIAMSEAPNNGVVCYLDENERGAVSVCSKLVRAADALRPALFQKRTAPRPPRQPHRTEDEASFGFDAHAEPLAPLHLPVIAPTATDGVEDPLPAPVAAGKPVTVIGASATLATGDSFAFIAEELGVDDPATMIAESPFDWPAQALFVVPENLPEPNDKAFPDAVANVVETMIRMAGGSVLGLFTSRRVLAHVYDSIFAACREMKITLLKQGDEPRTRLVERFRADTSSVLLGLESFWAGVDVSGDALRVVVIDRLPFPTPDDPIVAALSLQTEKAFWTYSVPKAIVTFRQGTGRLIRAAGDKGVVVCCDKRLIDKRYGKQFLRALPPMLKSTSLATADAWLNPKPPPAWDEP